MFDWNMVDNYLFEYCGNLYEYTGSNGKQAVFSDINNGDPIFVDIDRIPKFFDQVIER